MTRRPVAAGAGALLAAVAFAATACGEDEERGDVQIEQSTGTATTGSGTTGTGTTGTETGGTGTAETSPEEVTEPETSTMR